MLDILLTRSVTENRRFVKKFADKNINFICCSQIEQQIIALDYTKLNYCNVIITSKFAAYIIANEYLHPANIYVVGQISANILARNKNLKIVQIFSNIDELSRNIDIFDKNDSTVYFTGNYLTKDLPIKQIRIYHTYYLAKLNLPAVELITRQKSIAVLIYSTNTAISFKKAFLEQNLLGYTANLSIICLSEKIAKQFADWQAKIIHCNESSEQEMIHLLKNTIYAKIK